MADASIRKSELRNFLETARSKAHHVYAFLAGLPKEHFYLLRFLVSKGPLKDRNEDDELRKYTVEEFLAHYDEFDPSHEFGFCWALRLERIYSEQAEDYADCICVWMLDCLNVPDMEHFIDFFLEKYCEMCLYDNRPFEMNAQTIAAYGFTQADAAWFGQKLVIQNERLKYRMRHEYEPLQGLDFIRNGEQGTPPPCNPDGSQVQRIVPRMVCSYMIRS